MKLREFFHFLLLVILTLSVRQAWADVPISEAITPDIQALARNLENDPLRMFNYVHDHIRYEHYFGSKKGAELTLLEKGGNDFDQSALLVALLRSAGYTNSGYQFGIMQMPYSNPDGSQRDLIHLLGLNLTVTNWQDVAYYLGNFFRGNGYPIEDASVSNTYAYHRVWVTLNIGGTNYSLDPAFKLKTAPTGINLASAMGLNTNSLFTAAGGIETNSYVQNLNESAIKSTLAGYCSNLQTFIGTNCPNYSFEQITGIPTIIPSTNKSLSTTTTFSTINLYGTMPVASWTNQPTNFMSSMTISFNSVTQHWFIPQLQGGCIGLAVSSSGVAQLFLDTNLVAQANVSASSSFALTLDAYIQYGDWNTNNNTYLPSRVPGLAPTTKNYQSSSANYVIGYVFSPDWGWLQKRQQLLDTYRQQGLSDTSLPVILETLNVMNLNWQMQAESVSRILANQIGAIAQFPLKSGRMSQEAGFGYYIDMYNTCYSSISTSSLTDNHLAQWADQFSHFASAMEHGMIEQLQASNLVAASTVKMLELNSANSNKIFLATSANWSSVQSQLTGYISGDFSAFQPTGTTLTLIPQNGSFPINGAGSWTGFGVIVRGAGISMLIGDSAGIHYGGYVSDPSATVSPPFVSYSSDYQPAYYSPAPVSIPTITAADPVNMADGSFQEQTVDLSIGQAEPRGIKLSRYYSSSLHLSNPAGISPGWTHNYNINATKVTSAKASLGGTTVAQALPMLVATIAATAAMNESQVGAKSWTIATLIAKWGIDQLTGNAVSITLGKDLVQFVKQPDGSFTPPANNTMKLSLNSAGYQMTERHGRSFNFNMQGLLTNLVDSYGQSMFFSYNTSNFLQTITDWKSNQLTFTYASNTLTSVSDGVRSVIYSYNTNSLGQVNLKSITDPEGKTSTFGYNTNYQIVTESNALQQLVVSNVYDSLGHIISQYTQGFPFELWNIYASGWNTVVVDPAGGVVEYIFDDKTRLLETIDANTNQSQNVYDGQDHVVTTVSPLNETNQMTYDGNHNLVQKVDPLNFTNRFLYDASNNLVQSFDATNVSKHFVYNAKSQLTASTNEMGDWVTYAYDPTYGYLLSKTTPAGSINYSYDIYGLLSSAIYPSGLGTNLYLNNSLGDVLASTNPASGVTVFQYNKRRQLTNTVAPLGITNGIAYDAAGNVISTSDPLGNVTFYSWSATRHLLTKTLPPTPQGSPSITNHYDSRDWFYQVVDPLNRTNSVFEDPAHRTTVTADALQRATLYGYDADGQETSITDPNFKTYFQEYTARGQRSYDVDQNGNFPVYYYDANGNFTLFQNLATNRYWQFKYDLANRPNNTQSPTGRSCSQQWNNVGLVQSNIDYKGQLTTFQYDALSRKTNRSDLVGVSAYQYDYNGNLTTNIDSGLTLRGAYDAANRLTNCTDALGNLIQYKYDTRGNVTNLIYPGNLKIIYSYDSLNRLTNVSDWLGQQTAYAYDLDSELTTTRRFNGTSRTASYDAAGEITNIVELSPSPLSAIAMFNLNWDPASRIKLEFTGPLAHAFTPPGMTNLFDADDRLTNFNSQTVVNDANANMTYGPLANGAFVTYAYDARNRLLNVGGCTNGYDPANNRIWLTNGATVSQFVVSPSGSQVLMRIKGTTTNYYVYGVGLEYEVDVTPGATNTVCYHYDYRGSTVALTDANGNVTDRMEYSAYGLTSYRLGNNDTPFLYNGKYGVQTDPNGLLYMRARFYNPRICRFLNADPSGFGGGRNLYAFCNANPVSLNDPYGLGALGDLGGSSWLNQAFEGLGLDNSMQAQMGREKDLAGAVNLATLGLADPISALATGRNLVGDPVDSATAFEQLLTTATRDTILIATLAPGGFAAEIETAVEVEAAEGSLTTSSSVPLGFSRTELQSGSFVNRVYDSSGASGTSRLFGQSFSPGSGLPTDAATAITSRGLQSDFNNAQLGAVFRVNQSITVYSGTSLGGTAPELFIPSGLHRYLTPLLQNVPIVP